MFKKATQWVLNEILSMFALILVMIVVIVGTLFGALYSLVVKVTNRFA